MPELKWDQGEITAIVGLDLSLTGTGLCRLPHTDDADSYLLDQIGTNVKFGNIYQRHRFSLAEIISRIRPADHVFIEDYSFSRNQSSVTVLAELGGMVKLAIWLKTGRPPTFVSPSTLKKWVIGSGAGKKELMLMKGYKKFGLEFKTNDMCDAYSLADLGWHYMNLPLLRAGILVYESECLKAVEHHNDLEFQKEKKALKRARAKK